MNFPTVAWLLEMKLVKIFSVQNKTMLRDEPQGPVHL